jgi:hypothetical protein
MAEIREEIKEYITKLASTSINNNNALANIQDTARTKDTQIDAMAVQLKLLANTVAPLAKSVKSADENCDPNRGRSRGARRGQDKQITKLCNMGGYCWMHRFHSVGVTHDRKSCDYKKDGHRDNAAYTNRFDGRPSRHRRTAESCSVKGQEEQAQPTGTRDSGTERDLDNT